MCTTQQDYYGRRFKCKHLNENYTKNITCKTCVLKAHTDLKNLMAQTFIQNFNQKTQRSRHK
jgi:hypothetical protein